MNQPKSLKELVELAVQRHDASGLALSQIARKAGHPITYTTLNAIRQGTYKSVPREVTLRALAWLAGVDASVAFTAAGQPVPGPPFAEELPPGVDNLSQKSRKAALDMLRVLVDLEKDADHAGNPEDQESAEPMPTNPRTGRPFRRGSSEFERYVSELETKDAAERSDARAEQKTRDGLSAVPNVQRISTRDDHDGNIPLPEDYLDLAAHPATTSSGRREHQAGRERGEESQDTGH